MAGRSIDSQEDLLTCEIRSFAAMLVAIARLRGRAKGVDGEHDRIL